MGAVLRRLIDLKLERFYQGPPARAVGYQLDDTISAKRKDFINYLPIRGTHSRIELEPSPSQFLCEAVALLARHSRGIELGLAWARVRPSRLPDVRQFFTADAARILEEAAREFRRNQPRLDMPLEGFVVNLDRAPEEFNGSATLRLPIDGKPKRVKATFDPAAYDLVIRAFQDKTMLALDGDLYPLGQRLELRNPRYVTLVDDVDATGNPA